MLFGVALQVAWLVFCFGTVLIGLALLLFAPAILVLPFMSLATVGGGLIAKGLQELGGGS